MRARHSLAILGSTGSIGESALDVVRASGGELRVLALAAGTRVERLAAQAREFRPRLAVVGDETRAAALRESLAGTGVEVDAGAGGLARVASLEEADTVLSALVGAAGILPTWHAARSGKRVALANKESLVAAGAAITAAARGAGARILPVDSEHSALFQLLEGRDPAEVRRITLTASGGPFRDRPAGTFGDITPEEALRHPSWRMGPKVTIDSATLMNKGLEVIEAHWLFGVPGERISVVVHPQSIVHGAVELVDGSLLAHLSPPDMRLPIAAALYHPLRRALPWKPLALEELGRLEFSPPDGARFPALGLARGALALGGLAPAVLNAANEVAVEAFLGGRIRFPEITAIAAEVLGRHRGPGEGADLEQVLAADARARQDAGELVRGLAGGRGD